MLELAKNPSMQDRLYDEVSHCSYDDLDIDTLESMKYLDACIREVSRYINLNASLFFNFIMGQY